MFRISKPVASFFLYSDLQHFEYYLINLQTQEPIDLEPTSFKIKFKNQYPLYVEFFSRHYKDVYITNHFIYGDFETDYVSTFVKHETILYFCNAGLPNIQNTEQKIFLSQERAMQVIFPFQMITIVFSANSRKVLCSCTYKYNRNREI